MTGIRFRGGWCRPLPGLEHVAPKPEPARKPLDPTFRGLFADYEPSSIEMPVGLAVAYVYSRINFRGRRGDLVRDFRSPGWNLPPPCPTCGRRG